MSFFSAFSCDQDGRKVQYLTAKVSFGATAAKRENRAFTPQKVCENETGIGTRPVAEGASSINQLPRVSSSRRLTLLPEKTEESITTIPSDIVAREPGSDLAKIDEIFNRLRKRRRSRVIWFSVRIFVFLLLPTIGAYLYFQFVATPMFVARSQMVVVAAGVQDAGGSPAFLAANTTTATRDAASVQGFLTSAASLKLLETGPGYSLHFGSENIDWFDRLRQNASEADKYGHYIRKIKVGFDPTEGVINLSVSTPDPRVSNSISIALISAAEERLAELSARAKSFYVKNANEAVALAEENRNLARSRLIKIKADNQFLDPTQEMAVLMNQIADLEGKKLGMQIEVLKLQEMYDSENQATINLTMEIQRLEKIVDQIRTNMATSDSGGPSFISSLVNTQLAESQLEIYEDRYQKALERWATANAESDKQLRFLELIAEPNAMANPTTPRIYANTLVAFLILSGTYLMFSLTASVLKEQIQS